MGRRDVGRSYGCCRGESEGYREPVSVLSAQDLVENADHDDAQAGRMERYEYRRGATQAL